MIATAADAPIRSPGSRPGGGRIVCTTSSSGLYGNFGQSNYGAAKMALVGFMQTLAFEGRKHDIRVNCLAPSAATQMTENLYSDEALRGLGADLVSPGVVALAAAARNFGTLWAAGAAGSGALRLAAPGLALVFARACRSDERWTDRSAPGVQDISASAY